LLFLLGVFALISAKSDIQIILAVLCFGFGLLAFGLAGVMDRLDAAMAVSQAATTRPNHAEERRANEEAAEEKTAEVCAAFGVGSRVMHRHRGAGEVTTIASDSGVVMVKFDTRPAPTPHLTRDLKPL